MASEIFMPKIQWEVVQLFDSWIDDYVVEGL